MSLPADSRRAIPLARGFEALTGATVTLMVLGALVRAHGAGLACPDWPLCFGALVPRLDLQVGLEWGHRLFAGGLTLGLGALSVLAWRDREVRERITRHLALAWALLFVQVGLGGLTVLLRLVPWTVTGHLLVGTAFAATLLWTARDLREHRPRSPERRDEPRATDSDVATALVPAVATLLGVQIALGGLVSSHSAGLACWSFPTCIEGAWIPSLGGLVGLHVVHRLGAYAVTGAFVALAIATRRQGRMGLLAWSGLRIVIVQVGLGAANVLLRIPVEVTALHSAASAGLALVTALLLREWWRTRRIAVASRSHSLEPARAA